MNNRLKKLRREAMLQQISAKSGVAQEDILRVFDATEEMMDMLRRRPAPPRPEGGISLNAAERKYGIPHSSLSEWINKGWLRVILTTKKEKYVDEKQLSELAPIYKQEHGKGKRQISNVLKRTFNVIHH